MGCFGEFCSFMFGLAPDRLHEENTCKKPFLLLLVR